MILNEFVVAYIVMSVLSLVLLLPAAFTAWLSAKSWRREIDFETRDKIENKIYLVITLICLGLILRIGMIPLWFLTLQSLISYIPGAMCLAGVHLLAAPGSFIATAMKFFIPLGIIYWLILNSADRRIESSPFVKRKLILVVFLALFVAVESFFDLNFLLSIHPKIVSCCTSLFDVPRLKAIKLVRQGGLIWAYLFYLFIMITLAVDFLRFKKIIIVKIISAFSSVMALVFAVLLLHTKVSPLMLDAPYHQCVFCLWQNFIDIAIASAAVILGLWLVFACAILPDLAKYPKARGFVNKLRKLAVVLYLSGTFWITLRYVLKYFISK